MRTKSNKVLTKFNKITGIDKKNTIFDFVDRAKNTKSSPGKFIVNGNATLNKKKKKKIIEK